MVLLLAERAQHRPPPVVVEFGGVNAVVARVEVRLAHGADVDEVVAHELDDRGEVAGLAAVEVLLGVDGAGLGVLVQQRLSLVASALVAAAKTRYAAAHLDYYNYYDPRLPKREI